MAYEVLLTEEAEKDIDDAVLWYEEQQTNLGIRFYFEVLENQTPHRAKKFHKLESMRFRY